MNTSIPNRAFIVLIAFSLLLVLIWSIRKNHHYEYPPFSNSDDSDSRLMLQKTIPFDFAKSSYGTENTIQVYVKLEGTRPSVSHKLHTINGEIVADEYLFERTNQSPLPSDKLVTNLGLSNAKWSTSSLNVLNWKAMSLKKVTMFRAILGAYDAALYEADGVARLVVCNRLDPRVRIDTFVKNAELPDTGIQEGLKQADRELPK